MSNYDTPAHTRGASPFVDDLPEPEGLLHAAVFASPYAHAEIHRLDTSRAEACAGVAGVFTARDIPGENQIGSIISDEPLLAQGTVHFVGQPMVLVVAESAAQARRAAARVRVDAAQRPAIFDARRAATAGQLIAPSRTLAHGDVDSAWARCSHVIEGRADSGGQEHLYLETQAALALPEARGGMRVLSGTQGPTSVQRATARILGIAMNRVQVEVPRLGGAFGGKEDQATSWACLAALGAARLGRPVKLVLQRHEDMAMTGKRHPYSSDFKIGLESEGKILAFEATYYQNAGAAADLSTAVLERSLFHATNAYAVPHVRVTGLCCRTNLPPFTAFRGFGAPQAMFVMESAIALAAERQGLAAWELQRANLLRDGDTFPYGMRVRRSDAVRSFDEAVARFGFHDRLEKSRAFNRENRLHKRGLSLMPICFGISFTNTALNQAGALLHVYTDGSVSLSTAAVEMGQGVNTKLRRIAAGSLGIAEDRVRMERTDTARVANTSPTAASSAADLNGAATQRACACILERLRPIAVELTGGAASEIRIRNEVVHRGETPTAVTWPALISEAYSRRTNLSAQAFYATPGIHYDKTAEQGEPFAYHVYGTALTEVTVDVLRGTCRIDAVRMAHGAGRSLDESIDRGQAEGALLQGLGWMTLEELLYDEEGRLQTGNMTTYKVPDLHFTPEAIEVVFLEEAGTPGGVLQSKAIGEPPFMYGIGAWFAVANALKGARPDQPLRFRAPFTAERIFTFLWGGRAEDKPEARADARPPA